jgi:ketosteroid isomerase-like protein
MTAAQKEVPVETELAIRWIVARYCHLVDDREFDAAAELFADDAWFRVTDQDLKGRGAIRDWMDTIPESMFHQVTNLVVSNGSKPGTHHAVSDITAGGRRDGAWSVWILGRYHDTFVGAGRDIRFKQRILTIR